MATRPHLLVRRCLITSKVLLTFHTDLDQNQTTTPKIAQYAGAKPEKQDVAHPIVQFRALTIK